MTKVWLFFLLFCVSLYARENPFIPIDKSVSVGMATNAKDPMKQFEQKELTLPTTARVLKQVSITFLNLDGTEDSISAQIEKKIDWHKPLILSQQIPHESLKDTTVTNESKSYKITKFLSFDVEKNKITIYTKDKTMRDFMVTNPYKIVLDFKSDLDFSTISKDIKFENVVKATLGNHDGYYRFVIELDGQYTYKLDDSSKDIILTLY